MQDKKVTTNVVRSRKNHPKKLVMVTAYDATFASILDAAGVDILLVGDSLGMVIQGHDSTLPVTLEQMIYHTRCVSRTAQRAQVVGDLPFMSYQASAEQAVVSAGRLVQEGNAQAVKLEGGVSVADSVERIVLAGIPVMGHIGLTPQSVHRFGGYKVQGRDPANARRLLADALALERAGCYALVLESIPAELAASIGSQVRIPTIGIGAGAGCDGQVLVCYDLLGLNPQFTAKFVKKYDNLHKRVTAAATAYIDDVRGGTFPAPEHAYHGAGLRLVPAAEQNAEAERIYGVPV